MAGYHDIANFLYYEAALLDERRLDEWLDLLDEDVVYRMPVRITRDDKQGSSIVENMTFYEENKQSLITRVRRLQTTSAWSEIPPTRTRHFISNIRLLEDHGERVVVKSYFQLLRTRRSVLETEHIFGERHDVLRQSPDGWRIFRRTIYPDQPVLTAVNLSIFL